MESSKRNHGLLSQDARTVPRTPSPGPRFFFFFLSSFCHQYAVFYYAAFYLEKTAGEDIKQEWARLVFE